MEKEMDGKLQGVDTDSLLAEIERRKIKKPALIHNFAYGTLQALCEEHLNVISTGTLISTDDSSFEYRIYKAAMEMWFGKNVWEYINTISGMNSDDRVTQ